MNMYGASREGHCRGDAKPVGPAPSLRSQIQGSVPETAVLVNPVIP